MSTEATINLPDNRKLGYVEYGDPNGMPVLYFHGFPGSRLEAGVFTDVAQAHHCRLIGIDRPGMGLSSFHRKRTLLSWTKDVQDFAEALKLDKFSVISHSGGAAFAAACAVKIPEKLKAVAIVSGMAPMEEPEVRAFLPRRERMLYPIIYWFPRLARVLMRITLRMLRYPDRLSQQIGRQLSPADQPYFQNEQLRSEIFANALEAFRHGVGGPAKEMTLFYRPWKLDLGKIPPTLAVSIWHGSADTQANLAHAEIYAHFIPNAKLNIFENEGHYSVLRKHFAQILQQVMI